MRIRPPKSPEGSIPPQRKHGTGTVFALGVTAAAMLSGCSEYKEPVQGPLLPEVVRVRVDHNTQKTFLDGCFSFRYEDGELGIGALRYTPIPETIDQKGSFRFEFTSYDTDRKRPVDTDKDLRDDHALKRMANESVYMGKTTNGILDKPDGRGVLCTQEIIGTPFPSHYEGLLANIIYQGDNKPHGDGLPYFADGPFGRESFTKDGHDYYRARDGHTYPVARVVLTPPGPVQTTSR